MTGNAVAKVEEAVGFTQAQLDLIKRDICRGATNDELQKFLWECQRTGLDPFARQIYSIERWEGYRDENGNWKKRKKRTTQISIDGFRVIAQKTGEYNGQLGPEWCGPDAAWKDVWLKDEPPAAARVAALRNNFQKPLWSVATFNSYAQRNAKGEPTAMWVKMADVMLAKCAEALALRRAFPQQLGNFYVAEEMLQASNQATTLADEMNDEIPYGAGDEAPASAAAARSGPGAAPAAADAALNSTAAATLSLEDMAREAARRGPDVLKEFFNNRSAEERTELKKTFGNRGEKLWNLYPQAKENGDGGSDGTTATGAAENAGGDRAS